MTATTFFQAIKEQIPKQENVSNMNTKPKEDYEEKVAEYLQRAENIFEQSHIKVTSIPQNKLRIDADNLNLQTEESMILYSDIMDDVFNLNQILERLKVILNGIVGLLHHKIKFNSPYRLKYVREVEKYIEQEPSYNIINVKVKTIKAQIDKSEKMADLVHEKIRYLRDLKKKKTSENYKEKQNYAE